MRRPPRALAMWLVLTETARAASPVTSATAVPISAPVGAVAPAAVSAATEEPREATILFRWLDEKGFAHDTTDPTTIPAGAKVRIVGPERGKVDPHKSRKWWRARLSRLQAELHAAQDARADAEKKLAGVVKAGMPVTDRDPYRGRLSDATAAERKAQQALDAFFTEAKDRKIPDRWLR